MLAVIVSTVLAVSMITLRFKIRKYATTLCWTRSDACQDFRQMCKKHLDLFNPKMSILFRNIHSTVEIQIQKRLGTVKMRFYIGEML